MALKVWLKRLLMFAQDQSCLQLTVRIKWSNIYIPSTNIWLSRQIDIRQTAMLAFIASESELSSLYIRSHLDEETELGEEVPGDSLGNNVVILNVGTGNLLVNVVDDLFHGI